MSIWTTTIRWSPCAPRWSGRCPPPAAIVVAVPGPSAHEGAGRRVAIARTAQARNLMPAAEPGRRPLILLHGIWMTGADQWLLARRLSASGRRCRIFRYRSLGRPPADNARQLDALIASTFASGFDIVAHSLGGIVALHLMASNPDLPLGRMVLLGSPVAGSMVAARMAAHPWLRRALGRSVEHGLLGDTPPFPPSLTGRCAVIAGTRAIGVGQLITVGHLEQPNDGTVAVAETVLPIGHARLELPVTHFSMLFSRRVAGAVTRFLDTGSFERT
jgi:pimeloyl-ACP methyl ester carboxylesterase